MSEAHDVVSGSYRVGSEISRTLHLAVVNAYAPSWMESAPEDRGEFEERVPPDCGASVAGRLVEPGHVDEEVGGDAVPVPRAYRAGAEVFALGGVSPAPQLPLLLGEDNPPALGGPEHRAFDPVALG